MNTRFLSTFCVVADRGGLNAAARHLGLSSTSVAEQIRALEKDLNARLMSRHGRTVALTEAGHAILPTAREVLGRIDEMGQLAQVGRLQGALRVGTGSSTMISLLPQALEEMALRHPRIELKVFPGTSPHLYQRVEQGDLDCAAIVRPPFEVPKTMAWHPIREEPLALLCASDLAGDTVEELLLAAPFIRMDRNAWTGRIITRFLEDRAIRVRELFEMDAQEAIVILVARGVGASLLPDWGFSAPAGYPIKRLAIGDPAYDRSLGLIGRRSARSRLIEAFAAALRNASSTATSA